MTEANALLLYPRSSTTFQISGVQTCDQIEYIVAYVNNVWYANNIKQAGYTVAHIIVTLSQFFWFYVISEFPTHSFLSLDCISAEVM